ncbi:MAG: amidohydrolase family protein, partial [Acidimicrobiales bacterium]|nr:amidohydrolase family protein [Acidimicrobiales bacterium]
IERSREMHADAEYQASAESEVMLRKNWRATGAFIPEDRVAALDYMGFASQLVYPTVYTTMLEELEYGDDPGLTYEVASAANRAHIAFCDIDPRLYAVAYIPLQTFEGARAAAAEAIAAGAKALLIPNRCPRDHAPSHVGFDPVWAMAQEARIPVTMHVATPDLVMPPQHRNNGLPPEPDFHGGGENFRSVSYMAISSAPLQALSMLIFDGVLERFPNLKIGIIELGAVWVPGFMRQLDAAFTAFERHEDRLQKLSLQPSDYVRRQVRVTPYPTEPTGWIIEQAGPEICMFSSDFPHVEGGRNPLRRFDTEVAHLPQATQDRFFRFNFEDMWH